MLKGIGLGHLAEKFKTEGINLKLVLDMESNHLRRMMVDLEINWGARFKIEREIQKLKTRPCNPLTTVVDVELEKQTSTDNLFDECGLCSITKNRRTLNLNAELAVNLSAVFVLLFQTQH